MSRTHKDKPGYLAGVKRNEEELSRAYLRERSPRKSRSDYAWNRCTNCNNINARFSEENLCDECGFGSIEDLVTIYENSSVA